MVVLDNGIPAGGHLVVSMDIGCTPSDCGIATMGSSLDGTGDGPALASEAGSASDSVTCLAVDAVPAGTPLRVTVACAGVTAGNYGPVGMTTRNTADANSPYIDQNN